MINRCKVVFLDRDGTINKDKNYIYKKEEFEFIDGSIDALKLLIQHDFNLIIITNQSGIARGFYTEDDYNKLNDWMLSELKSNNINILDTYYCPHFPNGLIKKYALTCNCRKPKTELFKKAIKKYSVDEKHSWAIGDKSRDISICYETNIHGIQIYSDIEEKNSNTMKIKGGLLEASKIIVRDEIK